jgi:peroxiredoxin
MRGTAAFFVVWLVTGCAEGKAGDAARPAAGPASPPAPHADPALAELAGEIRATAATEPADLGLDTLLRAVDLLGARHADLAKPLVLDAIARSKREPETWTYRDRILEAARRLELEQAAAGLPEAGATPPPPPESRPVARLDYDRMPAAQVIATIQQQEHPADRLYGVVSLLPREDLTAAERDVAIREVVAQLPALDTSMASFAVIGRLFDHSGVLADTAAFPPLALAVARQFAWLKTCEEPACRELPRASFVSLYAGVASVVREAGVELPARDSSIEARILLRSLMARVSREFDVVLADLDGKRHRLRDLRGKVVLLNFWATWCKPCKREMPALDEMYRAGRDRGLVVLAVTDDDPDAVRELAKKAGYAFPIALDSERKAFEQYSVVGYPSTVVLDRQGGVAEFFIGARSRAGFERALKRAGL